MLDIIKANMPQLIKPSFAELPLQTISKSWPVPHGVSQLQPKHCPEKLTSLCQQIIGRQTRLERQIKLERQTRRRKGDLQRI